MKVLVCVKQVADAESLFEVSHEGDRINFGPRTVWRLNRYDEYALEEALLLSENFSGTTVDALCIGPPRAAEAVKRSISLGAANGYHLLYDSAGKDIPPYVKACMIADFASSGSYDLIFTGIMSEDTGNSSTGPMTAALLGIPFATHVASQTPDEKSGTVTVETEIDSRSRYHTVLKLPALLTLQSGINRPRYPSLSNVLRSKSYKPVEINVAESSEIPEFKNRSRLVKPDSSAKGRILSAESADLAEEALRYFKSKSII